MVDCMTAVLRSNATSVWSSASAAMSSSSTRTSKTWFCLRSVRSRFAWVISLGISGSVRNLGVGLTVLRGVGFRISGTGIAGRGGN